MADVELTYKGVVIGGLSNTGTLTMETAGKYCEANIGLAYTKSGGGGGTDVSDTTATPADVLSGKYFHIRDGSGKYGTIPTNTSEDVTVSGKTVTVDAGYYATAVSKSVADGSATTPATTVSVSPSLAVDSATGVVTASVSGSQSVTPTVSEGYVSTGTAGTVSVSGSNTLSLSTAQGGTITPTESQQTAVAAGKYTLGAVTVDAISSTYVGSGIDRNDSTDLTASGAIVTAPAGYYASDATKSVASGLVTAPSIITASGATVTASFPDNFSLSTVNPVSVTPVVTTPGYVTSGTAGETSITLSTTGIAVKSANTYTPGAAAQTIAAGTYLAGAQTIAGDSNLSAGNIKKDVTIFGVTGTFEGGAGDVFAFIVVDYPAGSTCTATHGTTTLTAPDTSGHAVFDIPTPASTPETWTVECTDSGKRASKPVDITTDGQRSEVTLGYEIWFVKDGIIDSAFQYSKARYNATVTENYEGSLRLFSGNVNASRCLLYFTPQINFATDDHIYLCCEHQARGTANGACGTYGVVKTLPTTNDIDVTIYDTGAYHRVLSGGTGTLTTKETTYIDISSVSGTYWVGFCEGGTTNQNGEFRCYNLWLSNSIPT